MNQIREIARQSRLKCLDLVFKAQTSHIGSLLGCADIMAVLFEKIDLDRDKFVLSAGWKACLLYYHLWRKGRITEKDLNSYCQPGSKFIGLAEPVIPEIAFAGGSMGFGLPAAVGFAMAKRLKKESGTVYVLMSDGEMQIGTTWESAMIAAHHKLDNLVVIVEVNGLQAMGETKEILDVEPLSPKWRSFGWEVLRVDGHDYEEISEALSASSVRPKVILCDTVKGKGVSFMQGVNLYHYKAPSQEEYDKAVAELNG